MRQFDYNTKVKNERVKIRFNQDIHGQKDGQEFFIDQLPVTLRTLVRRRLADNDGSVTIVEQAQAIEKKIFTKKNIEPQAEK